MKKITAGEALLFCSFLASYTLAAMIGISAHVNLTEMDTVHYLQGALEIRQTGGIFQHVQNCLSGVYREATQHPLYLLLLSAWAEKSVDFFVTAKIVSACAGFFLCLAFYGAARRIHGSATAIWASCLLLFSATFTHLSTMVACETLFSLFFILFLVFSALGTEKPGYWYAAGAAASLAFLSKSTGIFCVGIFLIATFILFRKNLKALVSRRAFWGFFAVFAVLALPLFIRNARVFGTPLYSDSSCVLWLDRWHDYLRPDIQENPPTLISYWRQHGFTGFLKILKDGLLIRDPKMIVDGLKPFAFWSRPIDLTKLAGFNQVTVSWQGWWAGALCIFSLLSALRRRKEPMTVFFLVSSGVLLVFVGWYSKIFPNETPTRLLYPLLFFTLIFAADFFSFLSSKIRFLAAAVFLTAFLASLAMNFPWNETNLRKSYRLNPFAASQILWIVENASEDEAVLTGYEAAGHAFYFPKLKPNLLSWPTLPSMEQIESFIDQNRIRHAVVDVAAVLYNRNLWGAYFSMDSAAGLKAKKAMPSRFKEVSGPGPFAKYTRYYEIR